jgi:hypothetical protein
MIFRESFPLSVTLETETDSFCSDPSDHGCHLLVHLYHLYYRWYICCVDVVRARLSADRQRSENEPKSA